jgi:hypothetical protein
MGSAVVVLPIAASVTYFFTLGHCFLPLGELDCRKESIETREYEQLVWYMPKGRAAEIFQKVQRRVVYPGQYRMDRAIAAVEALPWGRSGAPPELQQVLEAMGYHFLHGCSAEVVIGQDRWRISHYPSMLNRIEKDLRFNRAPRHPGSPNKARAANPAMTSLFHAGRQWRGVADARR